MKRRQQYLPPCLQTLSLSMVSCISSRLMQPMLLPGRCRWRIRISRWQPHCNKCAQRGRATPTLVGTQIIESPLRRDDLQQNEKMMMRQDAAQRGRPTSHAVGTHTFGWIESPLRRDDAQQREQEKRDRRSALSRALLRVHSHVVPGLVHPHASVI